MNDKLLKEFKLINAALNRQLSEFELELLLTYLEKLKNIKSILSNAYEKAGIHGPVKEGELPGWHFAEMNKYGRLEKLEVEIAKEIREISGVSLDLLNSQFKTTYRNTAELTAEAINKGADVSIQFGKINNDEVLEALKNPYDRVGWDWRSKGHHVNAINKVKSEITSGLIEGKGYAQTAANIKDRVNDLANNVVRIVRTESHRIQSKARNSVIDNSIKNGKSLGLSLVKVIIAVLDNKTRPQSEQMNGQMAGKDGLFRYPNGVRGLPGQTGVAEYDINDRETVIVQEKKEYLEKRKQGEKL